MNKILFVFLFLLSTYAYSWDGAVSGKVAKIDVTSGENYGFRVYLEGYPKLCGNDHNWAYLNETNSNYKTYVAVLLSAKAAKQDVVIYTNRKGAVANGYCNIGYISVN